jgi:hypothetical protein
MPAVPFKACQISLFDEDVFHVKKQGQSSFSSLVRRIFRLLIGRMSRCMARVLKSISVVIENGLHHKTIRST